MSEELEVGSLRVVGKLLTSSPADYQSKTITVLGTCSTVSPNGFTLTTTDNETIRVVLTPAESASSHHHGPPQLADGQYVDVTGKVDFRGNVMATFAGVNPIPNELAVDFSASEFNHAMGLIYSKELPYWFGKSAFGLA